jgi:hypothetical protein
MRVDQARKYVKALRGDFLASRSGNGRGNSLDSPIANADVQYLLALGRKHASAANNEIKFPHD